jgi:hypothetical protein
MSAIAYVVTEGQADVEILKRCLPDHIGRSVEFCAGQGKYSAMSLAETILAMKRVPVALVEDADALSEQGVRERENFLRYTLRQAAAGVPFQVFVVVPEIEALFFQDRAFVEHFAGQRLSDREWDAAQRHPKEWLAGTLAGHPVQVKEMLAALSEKELRAIQQHPLIRGLSEFLASVASREAAASPG